MKADIFIPTSNRPDALGQCLRSLNKQTNKNFKIYLVGIEKDSEIEDLTKKYGDLEFEYFIQKKPGIIGAANEVVERVQNEIFIRIDDDVILDGKWLENIMQTFKSNENIGGVTGPTIMSKEGIRSRDLTVFLDKFLSSKNPFLKVIGRIYNDYLYEGKVYDVSRFFKSGTFSLGSNFKSCLKLNKLIEVDNLEACNWSCRAKLLKEVGGFDEIFLKGLGDYHEADVPFKIKKLGYKLIFNPKAKLKHNVEIGKVAKARPAPFWRIQNLFIFYSRHIGFGSIDHFFRFLTNVAMQNAYYLFRFITTGKLNQLGAVPGTILGFIRYFLHIEYDKKNIKKYSKKN